MKFFRLSLMMFALLTCVSSFSQLIIDQSVNAADGVQDVLLGAGVSVSNITTSIGTNNQIGEFSCPDCNLGIASGIVMASGTCTGSAGPNNTGSTSSVESGFGASDPDLSLLAGGSLNDCVVIEFDFVPTGDSLAFNFVFGSEEYSEWLGYGDSFGFFISGPGISGPYSNNGMNIALIPGTSTHVSVPNVNNGGSNTGPCQNCSYFNWNGYGYDSPYNSDDWYIQCDGFTDVLTASATVQCGETYHIKLAIADQFDTSWDSFVFLEAGSFQSNQVEMAFEPPAISPGQDMLYEGCDVANITFSRSSAAVEITYDVVVSGTATNGVDYSMIPSTLTFGIGVTTIMLPVNALEDGLTEGNESVTIEISGTGVCSGTETTTYTFYIADVIPLQATIADIVIDCNETATLAPQITGGFGFYTVQWSNGMQGTSIDVNPDVNTDYFFTITDTCGVNPLSSQVNVSFPNYAAISVNVGMDQQISCLNDLIVNSVVAGGYGVYTYNWNVNGIIVPGNQQLVYQTDDAGTVTLTVTDECGATGSDQMNFTFPPVPVNVILPPDMNVTCLDITNLFPQVSGGIGGYTYSWQVDGVVAGTNPNLAVQADAQTTVEVFVTDECENVGTDEIVLSVPPVPIDLDLGGDLSVTCIDVSNLIPILSGGVGTYSYEWSTQNGVIGVGNQLAYQTDEDITVSLTVEDQCGNTATDFISIAIPQVSIIADLGNDLTVGCTDNNLLDPGAIGGVGVYTYQWVLNGQIVGVNSTYNLQTDTDAQVSVLIEDQCGNQTFDQISVDVPPVPVTVSVGPDLVVTCIETSFLNSTVSGGVGSYTYSWNDGNGVISVNTSAQYQTGAYSTVTLTVEDQCGNSNTDQLNISVPAVPVFLNVFPADTAICIGQNVELNAIASGGVGDLDYTWIDPSSSASTINVAPGETTSYTVQVTDECGNTNTFTTTVGVEEVIPAFNAEFIGDWGVQLTNQSDNDVDFTWYFNDGNEMSDEENPFHSFTTMDPWQVTLVVVGPLGCTQYLTEIYYPLADLYLPNCFTPDGDNINEYFRAYGHDLERFEMWIFNRWGDLVFYSNDIEQAWDGSHQSAEHFVPNGVYNVVIEAEGIRGNLITKNASVTIVR